MIGTIIGMLINSRLIPRYGTDRLLRWGVWQASLFGLLLLILSLAGAQNWLAVIGPMFFCMIAFSLIYPQTLAGALQPFPHAAGAASSLVGLVQQLTGAVTGMVVAALSTGGTRRRWPAGSCSGRCSRSASTSPQSAASLHEDPRFSAHRFLIHPGHGHSPLFAPSDDGDLGA